MVALFADKGQLPYLDGAWFTETIPTFAGCEIRFLRLLLGGHFDNGHVWHVRPLFLHRQGACIQLVMEFAQPLCRVADAYENCRCVGNKSFHFTQFSLKRLHVATDIGKSFNRTGFAALQLPGRKDGDMRRQVGQFGMKFATEILDKLPYGVFNVGYKCVAGRLTHDRKLYAPRLDTVGVAR